MIKPQNHPKEIERLIDLESYAILDSLPEDDYDNLTKLASEICNTPISLVSLLDNDRQWFKSHHGLEVNETPKELAFCAHAINSTNSIFVVNDARSDERFHDNPLVTEDPFVIFYAGVPLVGENGLPFGTLCVIDNKPNILNERQINALKALSKQVINLMELRKKSMTLENSLALLKEKNKELERFEFITSMDFKSPLVHISNTAVKLSNLFKEKIGNHGVEMLKSIEDSSKELKNLISSLLEFNKAELTEPKAHSWINLVETVKELDSHFTFDCELSIELNSNLSEIYVNKIDLNQVLINLISFSVKSKKIRVERIVINVEEEEELYRFSTVESGPTFTRIDKDRIFKFENILYEQDNLKNIGSGIGLSQINKVLEKCGGTMEIKMDKTLGSKFIFTIGKNHNETSLIESNVDLETY